MASALEGLMAEAEGDGEVTREGVSFLRLGGGKGSGSMRSALG